MQNIFIKLEQMRENTSGTTFFISFLFSRSALDPAPLEPDQEDRSNQNHHLRDPQHEPSDSDAFHHPPSKTNPLDETSKHAINSSHSMLDLDRTLDQTISLSNATTNTTKQEMERENNIQIDKVRIPALSPPSPPHSAVEDPVQGESVSGQQRDKQQRDAAGGEKPFLKPNLLKLIHRYFSPFYQTETSEQKWEISNHLVFCLSFMQYVCEWREE